MQYIRKNVQLTEDQAEQLRQLAFDSRLSESEHIRRSLKQYLTNASNNSLVGGIALITNKESDHYNEWGIITHYDGEYYHIAPWCETLEIAKEHSSFFFERQEFTLKSNKTS